MFWIVLVRKINILNHVGMRLYRNLVSLAQPIKTLRQIAARGSGMNAATLLHVNLATPTCLLNCLRRRDVSQFVYVRLSNYRYINPA